MRIIQDSQTIQTIKQQWKVKTLIKNLIKIWWVTKIYFGACCWVLESVYLQRRKLSFYTPSLTNISTFMYLSPLWFNYVCFIIIKYFIYFKRHHGHFTMNERSDSKMDNNSELRTVENLKKSIKG